MKSFDADAAYGTIVLGVDEVGRGCLAGPVVAAAIKVDESIIDFNVNDSKKVSHAKRAHIHDALITTFEYGIGIVDVEEIDEINILNATKKAMTQALQMIAGHTELPVIVDGNFKPYEATNFFPVIKADSIMTSVAAASIIAKVVRDKIMLEKAQEFPHYGWQTNVGYGTAEHIESILKNGACIHHRKTFLKKLESRSQLALFSKSILGSTTT